MLNIGETQIDVLRIMSNLEWWTGKKLQIVHQQYHYIPGDAKKAVQRLVWRGLAEARIADSKIFHHEYRLTEKGIDAAIECGVAK